MIIHSRRDWILVAFHFVMYQSRRDWILVAFHFVMYQSRRDWILVAFSTAVGVPKSLQMRLKVHSNRMQTFWSPTALTSVIRDWYKIKLLKFKLMASIKNNSEFKLMVIYLEA